MTSYEQPAVTTNANAASTSRVALAAVAVFLATTALYLPVVGHDFVWDDRSILMTNEALSDWSRLSENLTSSFFHEQYDPRPFDYWRPLVILSHMVDRSLFGESPSGPHLVNALLHALTSVFVLLLAYAWMPRVGFALVAGLTFAAHPVHVEAVAWISGRSDLLFGLFFSLAMLADRLYGSAGKRRWLALSLAGFAAALGSKEAAVVFPILAGVRAFLVDTEGPERSIRRSLQRAVRASIAPLAALVVFLWIRFGVIGVSLPAVVDDPAGRASAFWTWWSAFLRYLELLVAPVRLTILHDLASVASWWAPRALAGAALFLALAVASWRSRATPVAAFGIAALLVGLAPLSSFVFPVSAQGGADFPLAERFLYVPSIGFCLFAAWLFTIWLPAGVERVLPASRAGWLNRAVLVLPFLLIMAFAARAETRIGSWASDLVLFSTAVESSPSSYLAHLNYAAALTSEAALEADPAARRILFESAREHYLAARRIEPNNYRIHYNLGNLYQSLGREQDALGAYRQAVLLNPNLAAVRINLGAILAQTGDLNGALAQFEAAQRLLPGAAAPRVNKGQVLEMLGRHEEAIAEYREALALEPGLGAALRALERARAHQPKAADGVSPRITDARN